MGYVNTVNDIKNNSTAEIHDYRIPGFDNIPTENSDNILTSGDVYSALLEKYAKPVSGIPAADLANGVIPDVSNFIEATTNDLINYYLKTETYAKTEVDDIIDTISRFEYKLVNQLPQASNETIGYIYLVPDSQNQNIKLEYITVQSGNTYSWENIGSTQFTLDGYPTTMQMNASIAAAVAQINAQEVIQNQTITDLTNRVVLITSEDYEDLVDEGTVDLSKIYMVYEEEV